MFENNQDQKSAGGSGDMMNIMGLWENTDKRGNKYLNGSLGGIRVLIFKNTYKQGEREPDYRLYVAKKQQQEGGYNPQASAGETSQAAPAPTAQAPKAAAPEKEDDIPF